jgi:hypothetical protein
VALVGMIFIESACKRAIKDAKVNSVALKCYLFFTPECPASKNAMAEVTMLQSDSVINKSVEFIPILSDKDPDIKELNMLLSNYKHRLPILIDSTLSMASSHGATTTPQVFLYKESSTLVYSGMVSNYYYQYGKHRISPTKFFLADAISSTLSGESVEVESTTPIGCKINFD